MKKGIRKIISSLLVFLLLLGVFPYAEPPVRAADSSETVISALGFSENYKPGEEENYSFRSANNPLNRQPGQLVPLSTVGEPTILEHAGAAQTVSVYGSGYGNYTEGAQFQSQNPTVYSKPTGALASRAQEICLSAAQGKDDLIAIYYLTYNSTLSSYDFYLRTYNPGSDTISGPDYKVGSVPSSVMKNGGTDGKFLDNTNDNPDYTYLNYLSFAAGDVDGDGADEIALYFREADTGGNSGRISVYKRGSNTWTILSTVDLPYKYYMNVDGDTGSVPNKLFLSMDMGDLDDDGHDELAYTVNYMFDTSDAGVYKCYGSNAYLWKYKDGAAVHKMINDNGTVAGDNGNAYFTGDVMAGDPDYTKYFQDEDESPSRHWLDNAGVNIGDYNGDGNDELLIGGYTNVTDKTQSTPWGNLNLAQNHDRVVPMLLAYSFGADVSVIPMPGTFFIPPTWDTKSHVVRSSGFWVFFPSEIELAKMDEDATRPMLYMNTRVYAWNGEDGVYQFPQNGSAGGGILWREENEEYSDADTGDVKPSFNERLRAYDLSTIDVRAADFAGYGAEDLFITNVGRDKHYMRIHAVRFSQDEEMDVYWYSSQRNSQNTAFAVPNIDNDTIMLEFKKYTYVLSDPTVLAALAAPPFFKDLTHLPGGEYYISSSFTSYGESSSTQTGSIEFGSIGVGAYVSFEQEFSIFGIKAAKVEAEIEYEAKWSSEYEKAKEITVSVEYSTFGGQDSVILYTIPLDIYDCIAYLPDGTSEPYKQVFPYTPQYKIVPLAEYNQALARHPGYLPDIDGDIFTHTVGIPSSYPSRTEIQAKDAQAYISGFKAAGHSTEAGGSSVTQTLEITNSTMTTKSFSNSISAKAGAGAGGFTVGVTGSYEDGKGKSTGKSVGKVYAGSVYSIPLGALQYEYQFAMAYYAYDGQQTFPVVTYCVQDVKTPPVLPEDLHVDDVTDTTVTLSFSPSETPVDQIDHYQVYKVNHVQGQEDILIPLGAPINSENGRFVTTDTGLITGTTYEYRLGVIGKSFPQNSVLSESVFATTTDDQYTPGFHLPDSLVVYPDEQSKTLKLSFTYTPSNSTLHYIWEKWDQNKWTAVQGTSQLPSSSDSYPIASLEDSGSYRVRVLFPVTGGSSSLVSLLSNVCEVSYEYRQSLMTVFTDSSVTGSSGTGSITGSVSAGDPSVQTPSGIVSITLIPEAGTSVKMASAPLDASGNYTASVPGLAVGAAYQVSALYSGNEVFKGANAVGNLYIGNNMYTLALTGGSQIQYGDALEFAFTKSGTDATGEATFEIMERGESGFYTHVPAYDSWIAGNALTPKKTGNFALVAKVAGTMASQKYFSVTRLPITVPALPSGSHSFGAAPQTLSFTAPALVFGDAFGYTLAFVDSTGRLTPQDTAMPVGSYTVCLQKGGTVYNATSIREENYDFSLVLGTYRVEGRTFKVNYAADAPAGLANGTISASPNFTTGSLRDEKEEIAFTAFPAANYTVEKWTLNGALAQSGGTSYTLTVPAEEVTVMVYFKKAENLLTYGANPDAGGTVTVSPHYASGKVVPAGTPLVFTALPNPGYQFQGWQKDGISAGDAALTYRLSMPASAVAVTGIFSAGNYVLTYDAPILASYKEGGGLIASGTSLPAGTKVVLSAPGYTVTAGWYTVTNGTPSLIPGSANQQTYEFEMLSQAHYTVSAQRNSYSVSAAGDANGTVSFTVNGTNGTSGSNYQGGSALVFAANPAAGYRLAQWTYTHGTEGQKNASGSSLTIDRLAGALSVTAAFEPIPTYTLTLASVGGSADYSVTCNGVLAPLSPQGTLSVKAGDLISIAEPTASKGTYLSDLYVNGVNTEKVFPCERTIEGNLTVTFKFEALQTFAVSFSADISATADAQRLASGESVMDGSLLEFFTTPPMGKMVDSWHVTVDGVAQPVATVENALRMNASGDTDVSVRFRDIQTHQIVINQTQSGVIAAVYEPDGYDDPDTGEYEVRDGALVTFTLTPDAHFTGRDLLLSSGSWESLTRAADGGYIGVLRVTEDITVTAALEAAYSITVQSSTGGTASASILWAMEDEIVTLIATPSQHFVFYGWTGSDADLIPNEKASTVSFKMPAHDIHLRAEFEETYSVEIVNLNNGTASASPLRAKAGQTISLAAYPSSGYEFAGWSTNTPGVTFANSLSPNTTFPMPERNVILTANFRSGSSASYAVTVKNSGGGSAQSSVQQAKAGDRVPIFAAADSGYVFDGWTTETQGLVFENAKAANTSFLMPNGPASVTASFKASQSQGGGGGGGGSTTIITNIHVENTTIINENRTTLSFTEINYNLNEYHVVLRHTEKNTYVNIKAGDILKIAEATKDHAEVFIINIEAPYGTYQLPVNLFDIVDGLRTLIAQHPNAEIRMLLTDQTGDQALSEKFLDSVKSGIVLGALVDFKLYVMEGETVLKELTQFSQPIDRVIPMPAQVKSMPQQWGAFRFDETLGKSVFVPHRSYAEGGVTYVVISSKINSVYGVLMNQVKFSDVAAGSWYAQMVDTAAGKGLVHGTGNGLYVPSASVTRAEMVQMVVNAMSLLPASEKPSFSDLTDEKQWYYDAVTRAQEAGLLMRFTGKAFEPGKALTREEMAGILTAAVKYMEAEIPTQTVNIGARFEDANAIDARYLSDVEVVVKLGLMQGVSDISFDAKGKTTRAQAATVLVNMLRTLGKID